METQEQSLTVGQVQEAAEYTKAIFQSFVDREEMNSILTPAVVGKATQYALEQGLEKYTVSHLLRAGVRIDDLPKIGYKPRDLQNFLPVAFYRKWRIDSPAVTYEYRSNQIKQIGFPIITAECVETLVELMKGRKVLDVGAGDCFVGEHLKSKGVDLKTLDEVDYKDKPPSEWGYNFETRFSPDILGSVENIDISGFDLFFISWCDHEGGAATSVLRRMKPGDILVVNGESEGGCTASNGFFRTVYNMAQKKKLRELVDYMYKLNHDHIRYHAVHDHFTVYQVK